MKLILSLLIVLAFVGYLFYSVVQSIHEGIKYYNKHKRLDFDEDDELKK